jgi:antitoxin YefM
MAMSVTTYSNARKNFKALIEQVNEDSDAITITTKDNNNAVLISEAEYNKFVETIYLLQNPANAKHLAKSMEQLEQSEVKEVSLDE